MSDTKTTRPTFSQREFILSSRGAPCRFTLFYEDERLTMVGLNDLRFTVEEWEEISAAFSGYRAKP